MMKPSNGGTVEPEVLFPIIVGAVSAVAIFVSVAAMIITLRLRHYLQTTERQEVPVIIEDIPPHLKVIAKAPLYPNGMTLKDGLQNAHPQNDKVWNQLIATFYTRAGDDPRISPYFWGKDVEEIQKHFLAALLVVGHTGLTEATADTLGEKHQHLNIADLDFDATVQVLVQVLQDYKVPWSTIQQLNPAVLELRKRIVMRTAAAPV